MARVPFDSTIPFLRQGYPFISLRCDALGTDLFTSRLGLRPITFVRGAEAAEWFYARDRFTRVGALPPSAQHLLQDTGSVQTLDGEAHRHRARRRRCSTPSPVTESAGSHASSRPASQGPDMLEPPPPQRTPTVKRKLAAGVTQQPGSGPGVAR